MKDKIYAIQISDLPPPHPKKKIWETSREVEPNQQDEYTSRLGLTLSFIIE
jgi:hypothetical protein